MLDLNDFFLFVQVVDRGGFTAASRTLQAPKSTLSHRIQRLEAVSRTAAQPHVTQVRYDRCRRGVLPPRGRGAPGSGIGRGCRPASAERAERYDTMHWWRGDHAVRHDRHISDFLIRYPKVNVVVHAVDRAVDIVGENFAIRAHSGPLPDSALVQRTLAPAPWFLFAGSDYLAANGEPQKPQDLRDHPSLFMMRTGVDLVWRLRHARHKNEVVIPLTPRLLSDDEIGLQDAAIRGVGIVALPGYICRAAVKSGALRRVLPNWIAGDSTITALIPYRQGLLPSVRAFLDHLATEIPKAVLM
jgi:DNA-binding transcriptional LysR family regulator